VFPTSGSSREMRPGSEHDMVLVISADRKPESCWVVGSMKGSSIDPRTIVNSDCPILPASPLVGVVFDETSVTERGENITVTD